MAEPSWRVRTGETLLVLETLNPLGSDKSICLSSEKDAVWMCCCLVGVTFSSNLILSFSVILKLLDWLMCYVVLVMGINWYQIRYCFCKFRGLEVVRFCLFICCFLFAAQLDGRAAAAAGSDRKQRKDSHRRRRRRLSFYKYAYIVTPVQYWILLLCTRHGRRGRHARRRRSK